jgi:type VI secretion system protein ImpL
LVEAARATFSRVSVAERVYSRIRDSADAAAIPAWVPAQAMGPAGVPLFTRASGKPLTEGVPGFYSIRGFQLVLLPALTHAARDVADESWVLGPGQQVDSASPDMQNLEQNVIKLYEADYEAQWNAMLGDLNLKPATNIGQAVQNLYILGSPQSPMQRLLASMSTQLQLSKGAVLPKPGGKALALPGASVVNADAAALQGLIGSAGAENSAPALGADVDAYYAPLITYVGGGPGSPMSLTLSLVNSLQQQLAALASAAPGATPAAPAAGGDAASLLQGEAATDPQPVARWIQAMVVNANGLRGGSAAKAAAAAFNGASGPAQLCQQAVAGRYPFVAASSSDIPLGDFTHLFAPNGLIDAFFTQQVQPFVDMSGRTWRVEAINGVTPPISQGALAEFQRAETIKQLFFATGATPSVQFSLTPTSLDADAAQAKLELGAISVSYAHGPQVPTMVTWPGADGMQTARLIITQAGGNPAEIDAAGPWALFHLFSQGSLSENGSSDQYTLTFNIGGHRVSYSIGANSVLNPFAPGMLTDFRCPSLQG